MDFGSSDRNPLATAGITILVFTPNPTPEESDFDRSAHIPNATLVNAMPNRSLKIRIDAPMRIDCHAYVNVF